VAALRKVGATVYSLHRVGAGVPDLLVGFRRKTYLLEVKAEEGTLTDQQKGFVRTWAGHPVCIVRTIEEAFGAIGL